MTKPRPHLPHFRCALAVILSALASLFIASAQAAGPSVDLVPYAIGHPVTTDLWVDPVSGSDDATGTAPSTPLRTFTAAWNRIPIGSPLAKGYRILLEPGDYSRGQIPGTMESRLGTYEHPIEIVANRGRDTTRLLGSLTVTGCSYLYFIDLNIEPDPAGDPLRFDRCDHVLARGLRLNGGVFKTGRPSPVADDTLSALQCRSVYVEECEVSGAGNRGVDFVGVVGGHVLWNRIHNTQDWNMAARGGSAGLTIANNEFFDGGSGGFSTGPNTGFQFMRPPYLHYEAYDLKVVNNLIHDEEGAGLGVSGGYNILMAYNTLYRVGRRDHTVEFLHGLRTCDGQPADPGRTRCKENLDAGGWGTSVVDDGFNASRIPNRHVYFYNNLIDNPKDGPAAPRIFAVSAPWRDAIPADSTAPRPALADDDLQIRGNVVYNGGAASPLGVGDANSGCRADNPICNSDRIGVENVLNRLEPGLVEPARGDFHLNAEFASIAGQVGFRIESFPGGDSPYRPPVPSGTLTNVIALDRQGTPRSNLLPGAYQTPAAPAPGDVNGDGSVDVLDLTLLLQIFLDNVTPTPIQRMAGDVRPKPGTDGRPYGNGLIEADDINWLLKRVLGLEFVP